MKNLRVSVEITVKEAGSYENLSSREIVLQGSEDLLNELFDGVDLRSQIAKSVRECLDIAASVDGLPGKDEVVVP